MKRTEFPSFSIDPSDLNLPTNEEKLEEWLFKQLN